MKHIRIWGCWGFAMFAVVLSPVVVILAIPVAIGVGLDVFDLAGETPIVLALCTPLAIMLLRRLSAGTTLRRAAAYLWSRRHLDHAADLIHAP